MKFSEYILVQEAVYAGNVGMMEMFKFYQVANEGEKTLMKKFIESKAFEKAWDLLEKVTGVKLQR